MREPALVTIAGVAMEDAFRDDAVDHALRLAQHFRGVVLVARGDALLTFLIAVRTSVRRLMLWVRPRLGVRASVRI